MQSNFLYTVKSLTAASFGILNNNNKMLRLNPVSKCNPRPYALRAWSSREVGGGEKRLGEMLKNWGFSTKIIDPCWALKCSSSENPQVRQQRLVWLWQIPRLTRKTPTWVGASGVSERVRVKWGGEVENSLKWLLQPFRLSALSLGFKLSGITWGLRFV